MKCPKCQAVNGDHRSFCKQCGFRLLFPCFHCGFLNEVEDAYCGGCGRDRTASSNPTERPAAAANPLPGGAKVPSAFLAELLQEEPAKAASDSNETKKAVTQQDIDKLFKA